MPMWGIVYKTDAQIAKRAHVAYEVPRTDPLRES